MTFTGEQYGQAMWSNFPVSDVPRPGLRLGDLSGEQRDAVMQLLRTLLSSMGYEKVLDIMGSDQALADGGFRRHMEQVRIRLQEKMDRTIKRLKGIGVIPWIQPAAGLFLWCKLPDAIDAAEVARRALSDDVVFAPGNLFSVSQSAGNFMRFNVARMEDPKIFRVLQSATTECARTKISG